jgi:hypothetical protein
MDTPAPVILRVGTPEYACVVVETSDGMRYETDLGSFAPVYCFPRTLEGWGAVTQDASGLALVWASRFEVHVDQVIALARRAERCKRTA